MKRNLFILFIVLMRFANLFSQGNFDFEQTTPGAYNTANAVSGWTVSSAAPTINCFPSATWTPGSSEFSIVTTPIITNTIIGFINHSPLGGVNVARLNNNIPNSSCTKLAQTISVSQLYNNFQFAFAAVFESGHNCCYQSSFFVYLRDSQNTIIYCSSYTLTPPGPVCALNGPTYTYSPNGITWTNWQTKSIDLSPFTGSTVTVEIIANDCTVGDHYATVYFDSKLTNLYQNIPVNTTLTAIPNPINYCSGTNIATITGPIGYSIYQWYSIPALGWGLPFQIGNQPALTLTNTVAGVIYSLSAISAAGCLSSYIYTITPTPVNIFAIGSSPSCTMGSSGSATVVTSGGGVGQVYSWLNSSNAVVGTSSVASGLAPGNYTVNVSAGVNNSCGTASTVINIGVKPAQFTSLFKPFCSNQAYLNTLGGSNFQWYSGTVAIPANQGGTSPSYAITSPSNGSIYNLSYISNQGCEDSVQFTLISSPPGNVSPLPNSFVCPNGTNGSAAFSITPTTGPTPSSFSYSIFSTGSTTPFSSTFTSSLVSTYTSTGMHAGTYSINVFDGSCFYSTSFSVTPYIFDYTVNPSSGNFCSGTPIGASVIFSNAPGLGQYSYLWASSLGTVSCPTCSGSFINIQLTPPTTVTTAILNITITPTIINCPLTRSVSLTIHSIQTASIAPIPTLCSSASFYSVLANPPGGIFSHNNNAILPGGLLSPSLCSAGLNTFTYSSYSSTCISPITGSFFVNVINSSVINNATVNCGQSTTLSASGADTYIWNNGLTGSIVSVSPVTTSIYSVTATNTANLCSKTHTVEVAVNSSVTISALSNYTVCSGSSKTLSVNGASSYTWNTGAISPSVVVSPSVTTFYSVIGSDIIGCTSPPKQIQVIVNSLPNVLIAGNFSICPGRETTLFVYNVYSYTWNTGATTNTIMVSPPVTTTYTVTGKDFYGCADTKTITVIVSGCVGIDEFKNNSEINIYPNPAQEKLFIETSKDIKLILIDDLGRILLEQNFSSGKHTLDLKEFSPGVYFLNLSNEKSSEVQKFIKTD